MSKLPHEPKPRIEKGVPMPQMPAPWHRAILTEMDPGDSIVVANGTTSNLRTYAKQMGFSLLIRWEDGSKKRRRVWMVAKG